MRAIATKNTSNDILIQYMIENLQEFIINGTKGKPEILDQYFLSKLNTVGLITDNSLQNGFKRLNNLNNVDDVIAVNVPNDPEKLGLMLLDWISLLQEVSKHKPQSNEFELLENCFEEAKLRKQIRDRLENNRDYMFKVRTFNSQNGADCGQNLRRILNIIRKEILKITNRTCYLGIVDKMLMAIDMEGRKQPATYQFMETFITRIFYLNNSDYYMKMLLQYLNQMINLQHKLVRTYQRANHFPNELSERDYLIFTFQWLRSVLNFPNDNLWDLLELKFHSSSLGIVLKISRPRQLHMKSKAIRLQIRYMLPKLFRKYSSHRSFMQLLQSINSIAMQSETTLEYLLFCREVLVQAAYAPVGVDVMDLTSNLELSYMVNQLNELSSSWEQLANRTIVENKDNRFVKLISDKWFENNRIEIGKLDSYEKYYQIFEESFVQSLKHSVYLMMVELFNRLTCNDVLKY